MPAKLIFISHDDTRTGAPMLLLNLAKLLKRHRNNEITFLIKENNGALFEEFNALYPTYYWKNKRLSRNKILSNPLNKIKNKKAGVKLNSALHFADVIFSNTITNGDILPEVKKKTKAKVISYIHELEIAAKSFTTLQNVQSLIKHTDIFLAPSANIKNFLHETYQIPTDKILFLNYFIPDDNMKKAGLKKDKTFVIGSLGTTDWRKGTDIFLMVAKHFYELMPSSDVRFIWKGVITNSITHERLKYEIEKAGLYGKVILLPNDNDTTSFYESIDLYLLPSREDPYPLVVLEAAAFQKPTICFKGSGGANEFVAHEAGTTVPFLSISEITKSIIYYYNNRNTLHVHGGNAQKAVRALHQDEGLIAEQFRQAVQSLNIGIEA